MTDTDRQKLAAILGMLGSEHAGERAAAALQAEAFRRRHGLTWERLLKPGVIIMPAKQPEPEPPRYQPPPPPEPGHPLAPLKDNRMLNAFTFAVILAVLVLSAAFH